MKKNGLEKTESFLIKSRIVALILFLNIAPFLPLLYAMEDRFNSARNRMIESHLKGRDIKDPAVIAAMKKVPRHRFIPPEFQNEAYSDRPVSIGSGQTISQPYIVALMTQYLKIKPGDRVLEVGTGSGYQGAVLAELSASVFTIEVIKELNMKTSSLLKKLGYNSMKTRYGDGYHGWKEYAPYDKIIITAAVDHIPKPLIDQLKQGGLIVLPLGKPGGVQDLTVFKKEGNNLKKSSGIPVVFVPMTGEAQQVNSANR